VTSGNENWNHCIVNPFLIVTTLSQLRQSEAFMTEHRLPELSPGCHCCTSIKRFVICRDWDEIIDS
jgi:hypothetical protein